MDKCRIVVVLPVLMCLTAVADTFVHWVPEPRLVPSVSSKTEGAWATCRWCAGKIRYQRTYKWDAYAREWIETTKEVPDTCRKCKSKDKEIERLNREEMNLDRKLAVRETKARIAEKRQRLRNGN